MKKHRPGQEGFETSFQVRSHDSPLSPDEYARLPKHPIHIVLDRLRSAWNVGAIFRIADTARAAEVVACGYTACPPHAKLEKTALGTQALVPSRRFDDAAEAVRALQAEGAFVVGLETTSVSLPYTRLKYPRPTALLLGNEALGVRPDTLRMCDAVAEIPMHGSKNSLNVASACAVVVFEILRQWETKDGAAAGRTRQKRRRECSLWTA